MHTGRDSTTYLGLVADDEEAALAQPLRHLVAVGGLLLDDGKEAKVENAS